MDRHRVLLAFALVVLAPRIGAAQARLAVAPSAAVRPTFATDACDSSYRRGVVTARVSHSTSGWRAGSFASGALFSLVGVAGAAVVASTAPVAPDTVPEKEVSACYRDGYRTTARARNRGTALRSGLVGAAILPLAYIIRASTR